MSLLRVTLLIGGILLSANDMAHGEPPSVAGPEKTMVFWHAGVSAVAFSPDGKVLASASQDGTLLLWDLTTGNQIRRFIAHADCVRCLAFSPDGKTFASGEQHATHRPRETHPV